MQLHITRGQSGPDGEITYHLQCRLELTEDEQAALTRYTFPKKADIALYRTLTSSDGLNDSSRSYEAIKKKEENARDFCLAFADYLHQRQSWDGSESVQL